MQAEAYVVCKECGTRWTIPYQEGVTSPTQPRTCKNPECDAKWLDLSMFWDEVDLNAAVVVEAAQPKPQGLFS